jgi:hypothetical protein
MSKSINWKEKLPILAIFILLALGAGLYISYEDKLTYEQKSCILAGGSWTTPLNIHLPYECGGPSLPSAISPPEWGKSGCYCGPDKCWDKIKLKCR